MGCYCLKVKNIETEITTNNSKEYHHLFKKGKKEKTRNTDTYINSVKTTDKNTEIIHQTKTEINKEKKNNFSKYNSISSKKTLDKNINENKNNKIIINKIINTKLIHNKIKDNDLSKKNYKAKTNTNTKKLFNLNKPKDEFSQYIFTHINQLRQNPQLFITKIEEAKNFIEYNESNKLIYKKNIKVALSQGLLAFEEAKSILKMALPMNKLIFEPKLVVKLPENEEEILDKNFFKNKIKKMKEKGIPIKSYWRDIIKEKETSFLMMIIDDTGIKAGLKRKDILDPNMKYIGICSKNIGKYFICFVTFSDCKVN